MIQLVIGAAILLLGSPFFVRGWIFSLRPDHPISLRAKERNLRLGLETDMKLWGRRVRRFGFILVTVGAALSAWGLSVVL